MDELPMRKVWSNDLAHSLGMALNTPPTGIGPDWRLLADRLGYTYLEIRRLEQTAMPTETLLWNWLLRPGSSVGAFRQALRDIGADALLQVMDDTAVGRKCTLTSHIYFLSLSLFLLLLFFMQRLCHKYCLLCLWLCHCVCVTKSFLKPFLITAMIPEGMPINSVW